MNVPNAEVCPRIINLKLVSPSNSVVTSATLSRALAANGDMVPVGRCAHFSRVRACDRDGQ